MNKISNNLNRVIKKNLKAKFNNIIENIKSIIIEEYDDKLMGVRIDRRSKIDYYKYRADFIDRLNMFEFIDYKANGVTLNIPDMETFDFSAGLEIVEMMMEGSVGIYVEVNEEEYLHIFGKKPNAMDALDKRVPLKDRVFLVRYIGKVVRAEKDLGVKFVRFPFSNVPPIDVLETGNLFVEDNLNNWIDNITNSSVKGVVNTYK